MSDNMPDFDNMSQEEIMAWMETLAKRQGASEGFTTSADMDVAEIDPNSVQIDEPGYVPYGQERTPAPAQEQPMMSPTTPPRPPEAAPPPRAPAPEPAVEEGGLAWLESLAADQGEELFNLDLSDLPAESAEPAEAVAETPIPVNPMTWLEDLARSQVAEPSLEQLGAEEDDSREESEKLSPFAQGVNPMEWLETLAKRQGAKQEELTTRASMNIPAPEEAEVEQDDYQPFSFDTLPARRSAEPAPENPAEWLTSLADSEGYSEEGVRAPQSAESEPESSDEMESIQDAINAGTVTPEQMQQFLDRQADELAEHPEDLIEVTDEDEDAPLAPAELPDWLSEMKPQESTPQPTKSIDSLFETPPATEMPDWLKSDMLDDAGSDLESIFEPEEEASRPMEPVAQVEVPAAEVEVDPDDPWTEAFDLEYERGGEGDVSEVPEWYDENINDPSRIAAVEAQAAAQADNALADAALPEEKDLAPAQAQGVPIWMSGEQETGEHPETAASSSVFEEMPDWLREAEASVSPEDVPDWLVETLTVQEEAAAPVFVEEAQPEAPAETPAEEPVGEAPSVEAPVSKAPAVSIAPPSPTPAPEPAHVPVGEAAAVLESARDKERGGDLDGSLAEYESMIRGSTGAGCRRRRPDAVGQVI